MIVSVLAVLSTIICHRYGWTADFPMTLVGVAIVFPIVFSIDSAYKRREAALQYYADLKGHGLGLYLAAKDWMNDDPDFHPRVKDSIQRTFFSIRDFLTSRDNNTWDSERVVYNHFAELSVMVQEFRRLGLPSGELSRVNQYVSKMIVAFDQMKNIFHYRTPVTLRAYSKVFIYTFPVIYGPFFAYTFDHYSPGLGYVMPILFAFILISLDNIQEHLESPYDEIGEDDIRLQVQEFVDLMN